MADSEQQSNSAVQDAPAERGANPKRDVQSPAKKKRVRLIILAVLVIAAIAAIPIYSYFSVRESTDDAQVDGHIIPISSRVQGTIISVLVDDNQIVKAGQELVRLDPADYQVQLEQANADLANARAAVTEAEVNVPITNVNTRSSVETSTSALREGEANLLAAKRRIESNMAALESSRAQAAQAEANYSKAAKDLARYKELVDKDEISRQQYDSAVAAAEANKAQVDTARAAINQSRHDVDVSRASLVQSEAQLNSAMVQLNQNRANRPKQTAVTQARYKAALARVAQSQASYDQAKLNLEYTSIKAPVAGLVSRKSAEPGQRLSPGQQLMAVVPLEDVWITANFKETQLRGMAIGQAVEIKVDAYGSRKYEGHIDSIAAASGAKFSLLPPENATGNYVKIVQRVPVKIVLNKGQNQDRLMRPGMSVIPTVMLNSTPDPRR